MTREYSFPFFSQRPNFAETGRDKRWREERDTATFITNSPTTMVIHDEAYKHRYELMDFKLTQSEPKDRSDMYLFEYAVTYTPRNDVGDVIGEDARILIPPTPMLANSKLTVERTATRAVVDDGNLNWDHVNVLVHPFASDRTFV